MLTPGFIAAHSHRLEDLTDLTVQLLARYPLAPLEEEVILVQSNGIAQWLKQALASHTGIATMLEVTLPARLVWRAYRAVLGNSIPKQSPYDKSRLRWRLMRLLPDLMAQNPDFAALKAYVAVDPDQRKLFQLSDKLADLFDQYQVYRADWLDAWTRGELVVLHGAKTTPLSAEQRWQAALWQALVQDIGAEQICSNRATLHQRFLEQAAGLTALAQRPAGIPPRIVVFGISSLPRQTLEVLHALKGLSQVVLCVHNPCQYHWADIVDGRELLNQYAKPRFSQKSQQNPALVSQAELHQFAQPLLASWGKQGRDYIRLLDEFDETSSKAANFSELRFDLFDEAPASSLLAQLQSDILNLRPLSESRALWPAPAVTDDSVLFQRCHSPQREVEVLQDNLLAAFAADPKLQPRDVMIMVPDINSYAPYIDAVFGRLAKEDPRFIPYTIADQGLRQRAPILQALELVLSAPQQRFGQSDIFDLLHIPAVQRRFGVTQQQVLQLQQWSQDAGARWGLHEQHRQSLGLSYPYTENSWQFAINRMLYGFAAGSGEQTPANGAATAFWQQLEPYAEVAGIEAQAAGALAELINTLQHYWQALAQSQSPEQWHQLLNAMLEQLFIPDNDAELLLLSRLRDALDEWLNSTNEAAFSATLRYNIVLDVWLSAVDEPNLQQRFMAGSVNFATLMPMRAIPFKRICLLGMNDNDYPRVTQKADFDLMAQHYRPGDRSRREDDRYLFLEALLSAREQLYISWVGMSAQDNSELPPSVLVGQLQDHLNAGWGADCAANRTLSHRLQPFAASYFSASEARYFSYAKEWLAVHKTGTAKATAIATTIATPLDSAAQSIALTPAVTQNMHLPAALPVLSDFTAEAAFTLADLTLLLREPAQLLARRRLGVFLTKVESSQTDTEAFSADGLAAWQIKEALMQSLLSAEAVKAYTCTNAGSSPSEDELARHLEQRITRLRRRGHLPYKHGADTLLQQSKAAVLAIYQYYQQHWPSAGTQLKAQRHQLSFQLKSSNSELSYLLEDELSGLYQATPDGTDGYLQMELKVNKVAEKKPRSVSYSWQNLLSGYVKHLFASAVLAKSVTTVILGEDGVVTLAPLAVNPEQAQQQAKAQLQQLMQGLALALKTPLPIALPLAEAWFKNADKGYSEAALNQLYLGDDYNAGQIKKLPYLARYYADAASLLQHGLEAYGEMLYRPFFTLLSSANVATLAGDSA